MTKTISQQVLEEIAEISHKLDLHFAANEITDSKVQAMYKILVTGNGTPSLPEIVRGHESWMCMRKTELADEAKGTKAFTRQIALLGVGQVFMLVGLSIAVYLGLK